MLLCEEKTKWDINNLGPSLGTRIIGIRQKRIFTKNILPYERYEVSDPWRSFYFSLGDDQMDYTLMTDVRDKARLIYRLLNAFKDEIDTLRHDTSNNDISNLIVSTMYAKKDSKSIERVG